MPIVSIDLAWLNRLLGKEYPTDVLHESLDQIGCDVEDVVEVEHSRCPNCGSLVEVPFGQAEVKTCGFCGHESEEPFSPAGRQQVVRLDLLAARPDLFDVGGLARALRGTLGIESGLPNYEVKASGLTVSVDPSVTRPESYRPYIACAVMGLPPVDETSLIAIMKLQENLHWGVGRDRKLASIGVYDMAAISGNVTYGTMDPDKDPFVPLGVPGKKMSGRQILQEHPKGVAYAELLAGHKRYPMLIDAKKQVLSMPPIINSDETKLRLGTNRVFIDVTGISQAAVTKSLDTLVSSLAEIGGTIETVQIVEQGKKRVTPDLRSRSTEVDLAEARRWLGLPLDEKTLVQSLRKMRFDVEPAPVVGGGGRADQRCASAPSSPPSVDPLGARQSLDPSHPTSGRFRVSYPPYRTDIRHMVDLLEDVAIGYGYGNIEPKLVRSMTVGRALPEETLSDEVRQILVGLGYNEIMSLPLSSEEHQFERLRLPIPERYPQVSNPKLHSYIVVRAHLLSGMMEALRENRRRPMPQRFFEIDNVVELNDAAETGAAELRRLALAEIGRESGYAAARSAVDALLRELGWNAEYEPIDHPTFVRGRAASLAVDGQPVGVLGELHPEVLVSYGLVYPVALAELTLRRVC